MDHHVHFLSSAAVALSVDVSGDSTIPDLVAHLTASQIPGPAAQPYDGWIRAWGYDEALLVEGRHPSRHDLDRLDLGGRPAVLHHRSGHVAVLNSVALSELGEQEHPDGVLYDRHDLLARVPRLDPKRLAAAAAALSRRWAALGVTGFVDATHTNGPEELDLMAGWAESGIVLQAVQMMVGSAHLDKVPPFGTIVGALGRRKPGRAPSSVPSVASGAVSVGHVKVMPLPGRGDVLEAAVFEAHDAAFPVAVHVVDVETLQLTLDAFAKSVPPAGSSDRIEHNALCLPEQVDAIADSRARVVVNPSFLSRRRAKYEREVSQLERSWLIRIRSLLDVGVDVRAGSDSPVTEADPKEIVRCAMAHPFAPGESVDLAAAQRLLSW